MNIVIISPFENDLTGRGDRNVRLYEEFAQKGDNVDFITSDFNHALKKKIPLQDQLNSRFSVFLSVPGYKKNFCLMRLITHWVFAIKCFKHILFLKNNIDVVFTSSIPPEVVFILSLLPNHKIILDVRDIWPDAFKSYRKKNLYCLFELYCKCLYFVTKKKVRLVVLAAPSYLWWVKKYYFSQKWKFIPLGFRYEDFRYKKIENAKYDFCYAGGLTAQFDLEVFEDHFFDKFGVIIGSGPLLEKYRIIFKSTEFTGVLPKNIALHYMEDSKCLLLPPNKYTPLPNKVFDYFALGIPVVSYGISRESRYLLSMRERLVTDDAKIFNSIEKSYLSRKLRNIIVSTVQDSA